MPNPTHHQTNKSQFSDDAGQWAVSKNIDLAAEYLQRERLGNESFGAKTSTLHLSSQTPNHFSHLSNQPSIRRFKDA